MIKISLDFSAAARIIYSYAQLRRLPKQEFVSSRRARCAALAIHSSGTQVVACCAGAESESRIGLLIRSAVSDGAIHGRGSGEDWLRSGVKAGQVESGPMVGCAGHFLQRCVED